MRNWPVDPGFYGSDERSSLRRELAASIARSPTATIITDPNLPDNPVIEANDAFVALTGYPREEIVGCNCRFLAGPDTDPADQAKLRDAVAANAPALVDMLNYKRDGTPFRNAVLVAPVFDGKEELAFFIGSQVELPPGPDAPMRRRREAALQAVGNLPGRQVQVLKRVASGLRNKQIAAELGITERTVKMHRASLMKRLGAHSTADLVRTAVEAGL
jgi:PAS domain S-box-containing protein